MNYDSIPEILSTQLRISILSAIYGGEKDFNTLKEILGVSDGNLSVQLSKLEASGCVTYEKTVSGRKKRTVYKITDIGRSIFNEYVEFLQRSINNSP